MPPILRTKVEPLLATASTAASGALTWIKEADGILQLVVTVLTLAWWFRLWIKNPNLKPPGADDPPEKKE